MGHDQALRSIQIVAQPQLLGQFLLFFGAQHRYPVDGLDVAIQTAHQDRQMVNTGNQRSRCHCHSLLHQFSYLALF